MKKTLRWFLDKERAEPLSVERLKSYAFRPKLKFVYYSEIESGESLDELIGAGDGACIILWDVGQKNTVGHYTMIYRWKGKTFYWGPIGLSVSRLASVLKTSGAKILKLLDGHNAVVNSHRYQRVDKHVQTCGRLCVMRWNFAEFDEHEFRALMYYKGMDPDTVVTFLTLDTDLSHWSKIAKKK